MKRCRTCGHYRCRCNGFKPANDRPQPKTRGATRVGFGRLPCPSCRYYTCRCETQLEDDIERGFQPVTKLLGRCRPIEGFRLTFHEYDGRPHAHGGAKTYTRHDTSQARMLTGED